MVKKDLLIEIMFEITNECLEIKKELESESNIGIPLGREDIAKIIMVEFIKREIKEALKNPDLL